MTIPNAVAELSFATNNTATPIALTGIDGPLYFQSASDLVVYYVDPTGAGVKWNYGSDYTIAGSGLTGSGVITPLAANAVGGALKISRATPLLQSAHYVELDGFPSATHENVEDRNRLIDQDILAMIRRAIAVARFEDPPPPIPIKSLRANKLQGWGSLGEDVAVDLGTPSAIVAADSNEVFLNKCADLASADGAAVIMGGVLVINKNVALTANTTLNAPRVRMAGGIITRGAFNLTFGGMVDCPDIIAFTEIAGAGNVTLANKSCSLAWFGAKQDTPALGATVTDNTNAWVKAGLAGSGGKVVIPCLNPTKTYAVATGATITGATQVVQDDQAYFQLQGAGYLLTYNGGGGANKMHIRLRGYGAAASAGLIDYVGNTGYIEDELWAYNFPNGEAIAYHGTTFNYAHRHLFARNCKRIAKSYAAYGEFTNAVRFEGGVWHNDSTTAADPNGWFQLDRGNGWQISGKPDIQQMHATPVPIFKIAQIAYVDLNDGQVFDFDLGDVYLEGNFTNLLSVGAGATFPTSTQVPREIHARLLLSSNAATQRMVDLVNVQGAQLEFGFTLGGQLFRYDANCDGIRIEMLQDTGLYTVNTAATHVLIESTRGLSYDNLVTTIIQPAGVQISTSRTITGGNGSPEGVVTAPVGSIYLRSNGGAATSAYVKETGAGNVGWVGK